MNALILISLLASLVGTALVGGLLYAFSVCIMQALSKVPTKEGIRVMQTINRVILNPVFFASFVGTGVLSVLNLLATLFGWGGEWPISFIAASGIYLAGVFLVTAAGNVPMNNKLDALAPGEGGAYWQVYLKKWTRLNHLRVTASTLSVLLYGIGFIQI